jgi:FlaA1/EpsC-like NDP-sugar epimerase
MIPGKTLLLTGGAGTFGNAVLLKLDPTIQPSHDGSA